MPLVHPLDAEMEELVCSSRLAASWIQTNGVDRGIAVICFYGISASNSDSNKKIANERYVTALRRYFAHHRNKPIFICMDANVHTEKSNVLRAMKTVGRRDVSSGRGDTFRMSFNKTKRRRYGSTEQTWRTQLWHTPCKNRHCPARKPNHRTWT